MNRLVFTVTNDLNYDQRMIKICTSLTEAGFSVLLIGLLRPGSTELNHRPYKQKRLNMWFTRGKLFYFEGHIRLFLRLLFTRMNFLCAIDMDTLFPCFLVSRLRGKQLILDAHEYYSETSGLANRNTEKRIWSRLEELLIPKVEYAYTVNESLAGIFKDKFRVNFEVIRNLPYQIENKVEKEVSDYFIYQGVLNKGRGLESLISIFKRNEFRLKIAGNGPLMSWLKNEIKTAGIEDRVELLGWVDPVELKALTSRAICGFNIVENQGKSYYYSLSNKFFDYMQAGIPQICTNFPEYARVNKEFEIALLISNVDELDKAIYRIAEDQEKCEMLKQNTIPASMEYNWEKEEIRLLDFYERLASSK